jgi:methylenetetrahydrofolate reductase (NADPH)
MSANLPIPSSEGAPAVTALSGTNSNLGRVLRAGGFGVAVEVSPPIGPNPEAVQKQIAMLGGFADAYNVTDNQSANVHMSSLSVSIMLKQAGLDPVVQFTCRDRNRLGLQADLLGAAGFGIVNVLALSGEGSVRSVRSKARSIWRARWRGWMSRTPF